MEQIDIENIDYVDITFSDFTSVKLERNNILEFSCEYHKETIENMIDNDIVDKEVYLIDNLLLVIKNYKKVYSYNKSDIIPSRTDIASLNIYLNNGNNILIYANLTDTNNNVNQMNNIDGNKLFIEIDEN